MDYFIDEWVSLLRVSHGAAGVPLIVGGLGLMLFGWRLWKICVILSFGVIGTIVGLYVMGPTTNQWPFALCCGGVLGLVSYYPVRFAISTLGGLIVAGIVHFYLVNLNVEGAALWVASATAFLGGTAFSVINRRHVVIVVTSFLGAVLLVSGISTWVMSTPALMGAAKQMAASSMVVIPFLLLVPMVMSCFYQVAEVHRLRADL